MYTVASISCDAACVVHIMLLNGIINIVCSLL